MVIKMKKLFVVAMLLFASQVMAADYYVRDCDGNSSCGTAAGTSWTNPYDDLSTAATALKTAGRSSGGDTIWVADGTYGGVTFLVPESGTNYITIKKATTSNHGTDNGWNSSYGDGQAVFTGCVYFQTYGYVIFDGNKTSQGTNRSGVGTYGFYVHPTSAQYGIFLRYGPNYVKIYDTEVNMSDTTACITSSVQGIKGSSSFSDVPPNYSVLSNLKVSNFGDAISTIGENSIVEYVNFVRTTMGTNNGTGQCGECETVVDDDGFCADADHGDAIVSSFNNVEIRYNKFNWNGQNIWYTGGYSYDNHKVYGNVFYQYDAKSGSCAAFKNSATATLSNIAFYNNTVYNYAYGVQLAGTSLTNIVSKNNIFINLTSYPTGADHTHDYNAADVDLSETNDQLISSSIFYNASSSDFRLLSATASGDGTIGSIYNTDMLGYQRGADSNWDRGAYEYGGEEYTVTLTLSGTGGELSYINGEHNIVVGRAFSVTATRHNGWNGAWSGTCPSVSSCTVPDEGQSETCTQTPTEDCTMTFTVTKKALLN